MTTLSTSRRCKACGAPNPAGRTDCWSCAVPLVAAAAPTPAPPPMLFRTCAHCGREAPAYHTHCPLCRQPFGAADAGPLTGTPSGWSVQHRPDGSLRLLRRRIPAWATVLCLMVVAWPIFSHWTFRFHEASLASIPGTPFGWYRWNGFDTVDLVIDVLILSAFTVLPKFIVPAEEWIVERGMVTIWRLGFKRSLERQITGGSLVLSRDWVAQAHSLDLGQQTRLRLAVGSWSTPVAGDKGKGRNTAAFAQLLSSVTGWPVADSGAR